MERTRKEFATVDFKARAKRTTEQANNALRTFTMCQLSGRDEEASEAFKLLVDRLAELETQIVPNL